MTLTYRKTNNIYNMTNIFILLKKHTLSRPRSEAFHCTSNETEEKVPRESLCIDQLLETTSADE